MKFDPNGYYKPTPAKLRKLGDALLGSSQFLTGYAIIMDEKYIAIGCIVIGTIGKFLTNFFTEDRHESHSGEV